MLKIFQKYNPRALSPTTDYPYGSIKNATAHDIEDGTPLDKDHGNDYLGWDAALMAQAGMVPDGNPDKAVDSQRLAAINHIAGSVFDGLSAAVSAIAARPSHFPIHSEVTTLSSLTPAEASAQGASWPVETGAAQYIVVPSGTGVPDGTNYIDAGTQRQLRRVVFSERLKHLFVNGQAGQADSEFRNNGEQRTYNDLRYLNGSQNLADLHDRVKGLENMGIFYYEGNASGAKVRSNAPGVTGGRVPNTSVGQFRISHGMSSCIPIPVAKTSTYDQDVVANVLRNTIGYFDIVLANTAGTEIDLPFFVIFIRP